MPDFGGEYVFVFVVHAPLNSFIEFKLYENDWKDLLIKDDLIIKKTYSFYQFPDSTYTTFYNPLVLMREYIEFEFPPLQMSGFVVPHYIDVKLLQCNCSDVFTIKSLIGSNVKSTQYNDSWNGTLEYLINRKAYIADNTKSKRVATLSFRYNIYDYLLEPTLSEPSSLIFFAKGLTGFSLSKDIDLNSYDWSNNDYTSSTIFEIKPSHAMQFGLQEKIWRSEYGSILKKEQPYFASFSVNTILDM